MIPALPCASIREAMERSDWAAASHLLAAHEAELRAALAVAPNPAQHAPLLLLLNAQREFIEELRVARDETARTLESLGRDQRGVKAYLGAAG